MKQLALLHAAGGNRTGVGHLSRTATLAEALKQTQYWDAVTLLWETNSSLANRFAPVGCTLYQADSSQDALKIRQDLASAYDQSVLFTDLLHLNAEDIAIARQQRYGTVVHINDSGSGRFMADIIVDGDAFKAGTDLPPDFDGVALIGSQYRVIRSAVSNLRPAGPWQGDQIEKILVTLGGADPGNLTIQFLEALSTCIQELNGLVTVVIGPAFDAEHMRQIRAIATQVPQYQVLESPGCLAKPMLEHDFIITLGGITAYESMCLGRPNGAIAWNTMQPYVEQLANSGLVVNLGEIHQAMNRLVVAMEDLTLLRRVTEVGWHTIDGKGALRIARFVTQYINSLV